MNYSFFSDVNQGRLSKSAADQIRKCLESFEGKRVEVKIGVKKSQRSTQQNSFWWALITILAKELGYSKDEMHEILKMKFLKRERVHEETGEIIEYLGSTAKLNKSEFSDLVSNLQQWASELNILLPDAGSQIDINLE